MIKASEYLTKLQDETSTRRRLLESGKIRLTPEKIVPLVQQQDQSAVQTKSKTE